MPESLFLIKVQAKACNFIIKETLSQLFSCEFCEILKNTFLHRTPLVASFVNKIDFIVIPCLYKTSLVDAWNYKRTIIVPWLVLILFNRNAA